MMGESDPQRSMFYNLSLETFVPADHPLRGIRPFVDDKTIRRICRPLYSRIGRPSIPPEQLFLALLGGYLLGVPSERKLVMELQCNMALRWFVGLNLDQDAWDASTFSQNRRRRFDRRADRRIDREEHRERRAWSLISAFVGSLLTSLQWIPRNTSEVFARWTSRRRCEAKSLRIRAIGR